MPELPEVETVVRDLRPLLTGRQIVEVQVGRKPLRRPWKKEWAARIVGDRVAGLRRRGKWILLDLTAGPRLLVHLGMTGQFTVTPASDPQLPHTHVVFRIDQEHHLRFRDHRRFGSVELFSDEATVQAFLAERLGPEPFDLAPGPFHEALQRTDRAVKAILLDQTIVAGVGNIYADEALHVAGLHPERPGRSLTLAEATRLHQAIAAVLGQAIEHRGSTIRDYVGGSGLRGGYQDNFRVYGRTGEACPTCETPVEVVRLAGRSSHYCPLCQRSSPPRARRAPRDKEREDR